MKMKKSIIALSLLALSGCTTIEIGNNVTNALDKATRIPYESDTKDYFQTPRETKAIFQGDCEDKAIYLHELLTKRGYSPRFVAGLYDNSELSGHAWIELNINSNRYVLDATSGNIHKNPTNHYFDRTVFFQKQINEYNQRKDVKLKL